MNSNYNSESDIDSGLQLESGFLSEHLASRLNLKEQNGLDKGESPLLSDSPKVNGNVGDDNIELFTPVKALNFMDATDSDIQQNSEIDKDDDEGLCSIETTREKTEFISTNNQGLRIIEGHASPLEDKTGQAFNFQTLPQTESTGFLTSQDPSSDIFTESPNLYDSLEEHEDGDTSHSPHRSKYSPTSNPDSRNMKYTSKPSPRQANYNNKSLPMSSPNHYSAPPGLMSEASPGEIIPSSNMLKRPDDIFEWSLPSQFGHLSFHESRNSHDHQNGSGSHQVPPGIQVYEENGYNVPKEHISSVSTEYSARMVPSGMQDQEFPLNFLQDTEGEGSNLSNPQNYSPISDEGSQDAIQDFGPESFHSERGKSPVRNTDQCESDQFCSLPNLSENNRDDEATKRSTQPQKPVRQNLNSLNQRMSKIPEIKICSRQQKHEQRQNINNNSGHAARIKSGVVQNRQATTTVRSQVHPRQRPSAQGGNVQEKQKPLARNSQMPYPTNQMSRQAHLENQAHQNQVYDRPQRGNMIHGGPSGVHPNQTVGGGRKPMNNVQYENRIAGVGQDDIISRSDFAGMPDSDGHLAYRSEHQHVVQTGMRRTGMGQQREATVGYQNSDQYAPAYANSDVGSEDLSSYSVHVGSGPNDRGLLVNEMGFHGNTQSPQNNTNHEVVNVDILGMEEVRAHLHSMLRGNNMNDVPVVDASVSPSELLMEQPDSRHRNFDTSSVIGTRLQDDVPDIFENFPSFSSKIFTEVNGSNIRPDSSIQNENQYLRDALERERYRRKHCEEQIQQLNSKLLETQQQLAVAISTDKKKDIMIEQLDRQLAKVVDGWKKREQEKDEYVKVLLKEKTKIVDNAQKQQLMINNFDKNMNETLEKLRIEKLQHAENVGKLESQVKVAEKEKREMVEVLEGEKEKCNLMNQEWEQLKESRELAEKRAQVSQDRLHHEQDEFYRREQELLGKIDEVKDANLKVIQMERKKTEEEQERIVELEDKLRTITTEIQKLELTTDASTREKESLKVEMSIMAAQYESSARKLEADLHAQMEKEICEQIEDITEKMEATVNEIQLKHRQQVIDLQKRQQVDMEKQLQQFHDQVMDKEEELRKQIVDGENLLREYRKENMSLKNIKQKLESQRMEVLTKLQYMMQSQWNEAVSLLVSTPHRRRQLSAVSSLNPSQPDGNHSVNPGLNLSLITQHLPKTSSPGQVGLTTNFGQYLEQEVGVSTMESVQQNQLQTAKVESYLSSLPASSSGGTMNPPPTPLLHPSTTHTPYKPASHSITVQHQQHLSNQYPNLQQSMRSEASYVCQQPSTNIHHPAPTYTSHQPSTDTCHLVDQINETKDTTVTQNSQSGFNNKLSGVNYVQDGHRNESLLNDTWRTVDSYNQTLHYPDISESTKTNPYSRSKYPYQFKGSSDHFVRSRSAENSPKVDKRNQFVRQHSDVGMSELLHQQSSAASSQSDATSSQYQSTHSNYSQLSDQHVRPNQNKIRSSQHVNPPDLDQDLLNTLYHGNLPSDSELHYLLNQRIENYLSNQQTSQSPGPTPAVMIRPPHQETRPTSGESTYRASNQMEDSVNTSYQTDRDYDNGSVSGEKYEGHLTLKDLHGFSPPVKQGRNRTPTDLASSTGKNSEDGCSTVRLNVEYGQISSKVEEHEIRQSELQHYIKMLLEKSPVSSKEDPVHDSLQDDIDTSRDLTVDLDLNDTEQAAQLNQELLRLQQLREKQSVHKRKAQGYSQDHDALSSSTASLPGVIPPEQMAEISQLLSQYQQQLNQDGDSGQRSSQPATSTALTSILVSALNNIPTKQQRNNPGKEKPNVRLSPKSSQSRKPAQQTKELSQDGGADKSGGAKKPDKKAVPVKSSLLKSKYWK